MKSKLSDFFWRTRLAKGLRFGQLARLCGCKNISKACRKIQAFEQGGCIQADLLLKLADALEIDRATVAALVEEDLADWYHWANEPVRPYIVLRLMAAIYCPVEIPDEVQSAEEAEAYASALCRGHHMRACLVLSRRIGQEHAGLEQMAFRRTAPFQRVEVGRRNQAFSKPSDKNVWLHQWILKTKSRPSRLRILNKDWSPRRLAKRMKVPSESLNFVLAFDNSFERASHVSRVEPI